MLRLSVLFFLLSISMFSQYKYEKEDSVLLEEVPSKAKAFIATCSFTKKIKWYVEESQDGKTFEAKTCYSKRKYSIEFDKSGNIIDAEVQVKFSKLPSEVQSKITKKLSELFRKFKIEKIQIQYTGSESAVYKAMFQLKTMHETVLTNYEIVVKGKKEKTYFKYEFLFNVEGELLKKLKFTPENYDNLEF